MELEFLGTGAGVPSKQRNVTSIALKMLDERNEVWLFDCGEATQQQILKTAIRPRKITKIFITHLHGDHIFGLPGFLSSRSFQGGEGTLEIYGPKGLKEFIDISLKVTDTHLKYQLKIIEISQSGVLYEDKGIRILCDTLDHRIECFGYRVEEKDLPGELQVEKLKALDVPAGPIYKKIKDGETVTLPDGRTINGLDFVGETVKGRIVTILGDTRQTPNILTLAQDADVLVHESTFKEAEAKMARNYYHSTTAQAARVAQKANVKKLLLTHISSRYLGFMVHDLQKEAQAIFKESRIMQDFDCVTIPLVKEK
ncbi:ribonuclease Z [Vagococcus silagei]|uniref:Ribonuclease Z n=1 Tax=Vagococcus silagei TaxID=2508885 RepID=A0A4S3B5F5_9ENTE|nr:ribonuclease Z [Vagococcus silagei]THB62344.1 ribonuclease Z [Vagococcus silagei]